MRAIRQRLRRVEEKLAPRPSEQDRRDAEAAELIRESRRRRLEAEGLPFHEPPPLPPEYDGRPLSIAEALRAARKQRLMEATHMKAYEITGGCGNRTSEFALRSHHPARR
jgi:hypothetical protein